VASVTRDVREHPAGAGFGAAYAAGAEASLTPVKRARHRANILI
jgi:hypothetical protein